ncbi:hypothetical protein GRI62_14165 [Erythrobacter arachoides]|uniref:Uncharacterized protein n=1 Tax=Aurantiacibacter arachoides TaxID=1850444 RepID=A0A845A2G9_9SPHN|nr:hypothetical protein [Aurantiacibacter arachoides]MXO94743.1 hypothetical protein [Aurantiacibacter arachoides]
MLNFDPHKWLEEYRRTDPALAELAALAARPAKSANWPIQHSDPGSAPARPARPAKFANPAHWQDQLDSWCAAINRLDISKPAPGIAACRWQSLFRCAEWWMENYAVQAVRDGWGAGDVFGIRPGQPERGGLIDQLGDCRSLMMGDGRARWRSFGIVSTYAAGAYPLLLPFWEGDYAA